MVVRAKGILRGNQIQLDQALTGLPDGSPVTVLVSPREVSEADKLRLIDELCGSWADDPSLGPIFEEIAAQRNRSESRAVSLDDPA